MDQSQPSQQQQARPESHQERHAAQVSQWRDIGITAVAAAARYAGDTKAAAAAKQNKVVTLRDLDYFAG
ncbi:hypothetical protein [Aquabacter sediminis]|uniref:hypothetical protein n=1 Tax=Aquabacter sediminis TaxID=3029197 RepID=UPI00237E1BC7|nr:hypothetical protein [Aquabacter sp. P-9]MDE1566901.1 hypothetical protein [Aquabacter sp. P-9]